MFSTFVPGFGLMLPNNTFWVTCERYSWIDILSLISPFFSKDLLRANNLAIAIPALIDAGISISILFFLVSFIIEYINSNSDSSIT